MGIIEILKVENSKQMAEFIRFPKQLYKGCWQYVPDMDMDIRDMLRTKNNPSLEFSDIQPFLAMRDGKVVGRVVGIINRKANDTWNTRYVRFGLIDFIDDIEVTRALIGAVEEWGREQGLDAIQGPMGVTDFDKEGMLVSDFDEEGSMAEFYNYAYYPQHMEQLGFVKEVDWIHIKVAVPREVPEIYKRVSQLVTERLGLRVVKVSAKQLRSGYGRKFFYLMNESYAPLFGFSKFSDAQIDEIVEKYLSLVDLDLVTMVENERGELVAAAATTGSMNDALRRSQGRLFPFGWFHLLRGLKFNNSDTVLMLLVAVRPDYQNKGVNALVFNDLIPIYNKKGFKYAITAPQLEHNKKELDQWKYLEPHYLKRRRCWRKDI